MADEKKNDHYKLDYAPQWKKLPTGRENFLPLGAKLTQVTCELNKYRPWWERQSSAQARSQGGWKMMLLEETLRLLVTRKKIILTTLR